MPRSTTQRLRALAAVPAAAVLLLAGAGGASADGGPALPTSLPSVPTTLPTALPTTLPSVPGVPGLPLPGLPTGGTSAPTRPGTVPTTTASSGPRAGGSTAAGSRSTPAGSATPSAARSTGSPSASVGGGVAGAGYGCLSAGKRSGGGLVVVGQDVLGRLAQQVPQVRDFQVDCDAANGLTADADLVAAQLCLRLDPSAEHPLRATVDLLGTDVLQQLEQAGLPLGQVVVPCAAAATARPTVRGSSTTRAHDAADAVPAAADADPGTSGRLPFTGAQVAAPLAGGAALLLLGGLLVARARRPALARVRGGAHR